MSKYAAINQIRSGQYVTVYIYVSDTETGSLVDALGYVVDYNETFNGSTTRKTVTITGQSVEIFFGMYNSGYNWVIVDQYPLDNGSGSTPPVVLPGNSDLTINSIVPTAESYFGANDGKIVINATSSNGPIQYSIDNVTWQSSNAFTGLSGGAGTAYVKDAAGYTANQPYSIFVVTDLLISDPSVDLGNGNVSRWNAAFNPIYFTFQRKDFEITGITEAQGGSGNILVHINADLTNVTAGSDQVIANVETHVQGDLVYIRTANYEGTYEALTVGSKTLVLACDYVADDGGGFANINSLRPYYQVKSIITYSDPISSKIKTLTISAQPLTNGYAQVNFANFLKALLQTKDLSDYTLLNYRDMQLSASYTVKYAEVWDDNTPIWITLPTPYYVLYPAFQLGMKAADNMQEYVPFQAGFQAAKWLTDFDMPVYNAGFPFDLSFIFSEYMVNTAPFVKITLLDINQQPLVDQSITNSFLLDEDGTFLLNEDASKFIIANQNAVNTPIVEHVGLNRLLINFEPADDCYFFKVQIQYSAGGNTYDFMQPLICRVDKNTPDRPVYMRWIGMTGSWNYYRFYYNQAIQLTVGDPSIVKNFVVDWTNEIMIEAVLTRTAGRKMTVYGENIPVEDINGMTWLKAGIEAQILVSNNGNPKWQTVIIQSATFDEYETMYQQYSIASITFAMPSLNIQQR